MVCLATFGLIFNGKCGYANIPCMDPMGIVGIYVLKHSQESHPRTPAK